MTSSHGSGLRLVPQENVVFESPTVQENLAMGGFLLRRREVPAAVDRVLETFPALRQLQGNRPAA